MRPEVKDCSKYKKAPSSRHLPYYGEVGSVPFCSYYGADTGCKGNITDCLDRSEIIMNRIQQRKTDPIRPSPTL